MNIWERYRDRGVLVYGLHPGDDPALLADFVEQTGVTFPIVDNRGTLDMFTFPPGVSFPYPRDVVIGPDLTVVAIKNSFNVDDMDALVQSLLP